MSWYIQYVLRHRDEIRSKLFDRVEYFSPDNCVSMDEVQFSDLGRDGYESFELEDFTGGANLDQDVYDDLITLEMKIKQLEENSVLSENDVEFLWLVGSGRFFQDIALELDKDRDMVSKRYVSLCLLLDIHTNGIYSDNRVVENLKEFHNLTDNQIEKITDFMKSKMKDKIARKGEINE